MTALHENFPFEQLESMIECAKFIAIESHYEIRSGRAFYPDYANLIAFNENGVEFDMIEHGRCGGSDESIGCYTVFYDDLAYHYNSETQLYDAKHSAKYQLRRQEHIAAELEQQQRKAEAKRAADAVRAQEQRRRQYEELKKEFGSNG